MDGLSEAERDTKTIVTGMLALWLGFGLWWSYFDLVGRRLPGASGGALSQWLLSHLPITGSIAAAGAVATALAERLLRVFGPLGPALAAGAVAALLVGWARPAPWLLVLLLVAILSTLWFFAVSGFLRADAWGRP